MATITLSINPQKITNSADTNDHDINVDALLTGSKGTALIDNISASMYFSDNGATDTSKSGVYTTTDKCVFDVYKGRTFHYRGAAGSETFQITILNQ